MVVRCALKFCGNVLSLLENPTGGLSGHRIPKNEPRRSRWIRAIMAGLQTCGHTFDRRMLTNTSARICSAHFRPEQYTGREGGPRILERDAVPCVFKLDAPPVPFAEAVPAGRPAVTVRKGKGSENRPRPSRAAQLAYQPIAKRPVSLGNRTCKAIQSGNPGLQPTARPVPPPGSPDYCRLCFTNQQLEPLCSGVIVVRDELLEKIYVCTGVLIVARPKESVYVCRPCAALINNFSTFRQQICSNNRALLEQLKAQNPPEIAFCEAMPPLVGTTVSSVLSQAHVVRGPAPKKIILTPPSKNVLLKVRPSIPVMVRTPQPLQTIANPRLPTLTRAPNAPVIVKRIIYAKPSAVPVGIVAGIPPSQTRPTDEAAMDLPEEEIKTEFDDPLEGCGDSGNALVMPKPLKTTAPPPPSTTLKMRVESHPAEPALVSNAGADDSSESWKCWNCEQNFPFKFECAKHLLQAHQESVASIRERLKLDELNTNMLEMMALRAVSGVGRKVVVIKAAAAPPVAKRPRVDDGSAVEVVELE